MLRKYTNRGMDKWIDGYLLTDGWIDGERERETERHPDRQTDRDILWTNLITCIWPWHWIPLWQSLIEYRVPNANFLNFQLPDLIRVSWPKGNAGKQLYVSIMESICLREHSLGATVMFCSEISWWKISARVEVKVFLWVKCDIKCWASCEYLSPQPRTYLSSLDMDQKKNCTGHFKKCVTVSWEKWSPL